MIIYHLELFTQISKRCCFVSF